MVTKSSIKFEAKKRVLFRRNNLVESGVNS